jgi:hypothetical protein
VRRREGTTTPHATRLVFRLLPVVALVACGLVSAPAASAYEFGPTVQQIGPEETVFDWTTQKCEDNSYPDLPARAFKDSSGKVNLILSHFDNYRMTGTSLNSLTIDCNRIMSSHGNADPAAYDDQEWIASPYTIDGNTVFALVHMEYEGWLHPGQCSSLIRPTSSQRVTSVAPQSTGTSCWYNAVTFATSTDGGVTYTHLTPPGQLVASVPYVYVPDLPAYGYFAPSNVVRLADKYYYFMVQAEPYQEQQIGTCLVRSKTPTNAASWRAWDGAGFNVQFIDPYTNPDPPEKHVCAPVALAQIEKMRSSLTYNSFYGKYLLIGEAELPDGNGDPVWGFYYSTSSDLVNWSDRQLLMKAELPWTYTCGDDNPVLYPAVLNPASTGRNFGTTSQKTYIYFTRLNYQNCVMTSDRDLIRIPIKFTG